MCVSVFVLRSLGHDGRLFSICRMGHRSLRYYVRQARESTHAVVNPRDPKRFPEGSEELTRFRKNVFAYGPSHALGQSGGGQEVNS